MTDPNFADNEYGRLRARSSEYGPDAQADFATDDELKILEPATADNGGVLPRDGDFVPAPDISADDLTMQRVVITGKRVDLQPQETAADPAMQRVVVSAKRLDRQAQEDWYKYQMRASMPGFGRAASIPSLSNNKKPGKAKIDLNNPLLNGGITNGLRKLQAMYPSQVYKLRNSGTPIPDSKLTKPDAIEAAAGSNRKLFYALGPHEISANLDRLQQYISPTAKANDVDVDLINAIITRESKGMQNAISGTGALGTSQLTFWIYGESKALGGAINPFDPSVAIERQAEYLSQLSTHYNDDFDKTVAAYNQRQTPVDKAIKNYGNQWINHINAEGRDYVGYIKNIMRGDMKIPGYFGTNR